MKTKKTNPKKPAAAKPAKTKGVPTPTPAKRATKQPITPPWPPTPDAETAAAREWRAGYLDADEARMPTPDGVWPTLGARVWIETTMGDYHFPACPPFPEDSTAKGTARALRSEFRNLAHRVLTDCGFSWEAFEDSAARLVAGTLRYPLSLDWCVFHLDNPGVGPLPPETPAPATEEELEMMLEGLARFEAFANDTRARWRRWELVGRCIALYGSTARAACRGLSAGTVAEAADRCADDFKQVREAICAAKKAGWSRSDSAPPLSPKWIENRSPCDSILHAIGFADAREQKQLNDADRALSSAFADALERFAGYLTGEEGAPADAATSPASSNSNAQPPGDALDRLAVAVEGLTRKAAETSRRCGEAGRKGGRQGKGMNPDVVTALRRMHDERVALGFSRRVAARYAIAQAKKHGETLAKLNGEPFKDPEETLLRYYSKRYPASGKK